MAVDIGLDEGTREAIPIDFVDAGDWEGYAAGLPERARAFARACGFEAKPGQSLLEPGENGALERYICCATGPETKPYWPATQPTSQNRPNDTAESIPITNTAGATFNTAEFSQFSSESTLLRPDLGL